MSTRGAAAGERVTPAADDNLDLRQLQLSVQAAVDELRDTLATLQISVVDGYFVKTWQDWESGEWVADCPTVRTVAQEASREEAIAGIRRAIQGMLETLSEAGHPAPAKDV
jgi:predicted RNase H-like HicB family nuclease